MEDKKKVAERVRRCREKKKVPREIERLVDPCMPLVLALQKSVTVLTDQMKALQCDVTVRNETIAALGKEVDSLKEAMGSAASVADRVVSKGVGKAVKAPADLFARVVAEKEARLR